MKDGLRFWETPDTTDNASGSCQTQWFSISRIPQITEEISVARIHFIILSELLRSSEVYIVLFHGKFDLIVHATVRVRVLAPS